MIGLTIQLPRRLSQPIPLANSESMIAVAKAVRGYAEKGDKMALRIFEQQAKAIGRMFSIAANFTDPDAYFVGGGIVEGWDMRDFLGCRGWYAKLMGGGRPARPETWRKGLGAKGSCDLAMEE
jgi:predicted NBD/HSP70 family sugar kinase